MTAAAADEGERGSSMLAAVLPASERTGNSRHRWERGMEVQPRRPVERSLQLVGINSRAVIRPQRIGSRLRRKINVRTKFSAKRRLPQQCRSVKATHDKAPYLHPTLLAITRFPFGEGFTASDLTVTISSSTDCAKPERVQLTGIIYPAGPTGDHRPQQVPDPFNLCPPAGLLPRKECRARPAAVHRESQPKIQAYIYGKEQILEAFSKITSFANPRVFWIEAPHTGAFTQSTQTQLRPSPRQFLCHHPRR